MFATHGTQARRRGPLYISGCRDILNSPTRRFGDSGAEGIVSEPTDPCGHPGCEYQRSAHSCEWTYYVPHGHAFVEPAPQSAPQSPATFSAAAKCGRVLLSPTSLAFAMVARDQHQDTCVHCAGDYHGINSSAAVLGTFDGPSRGEHAAVLAEVRAEAKFLRSELTKCQAMSEGWGKERKWAGDEIDRLKGELAETEAALKLSREAVQAYCDSENAMRGELTEARLEVERVKALIDRDKTGLSLGLNKIQRIAKRFDWICEGRGPYEYDDDRYRMEVGSLIVQVLTVAAEHLKASGALADEAFHPRAQATAMFLAAPSPAESTGMPPLSVAEEFDRTAYGSGYKAGFADGRYYESAPAEEAAPPDDIRERLESVESSLSARGKWMDEAERRMKALEYIISTPANGEPPAAPQEQAGHAFEPGIMFPLNCGKRNSLIESCGQVATHPIHTGAKP